MARVRRYRPYTGNLRAANRAVRAALHRPDSATCLDRCRAPRDLGILGESSGDGLARGSAAVAPGGCSGSRTACGPSLARRRGCGSREVCAAGSCTALLARSNPVRRESHERRRDDRRRFAQGRQHRGRAGPVTKTLTGTARFASTDEGYGRLTGFARRWGCLPVGGGGLPRRRPVAGPAAGRRRRGGLGRAREAGRAGAGVLPGPWPQDRQA